LPDNYQLSDPTEKYSYRQLSLDYDQRPHAVIILYSALKINDKVSLHKLMDNCKRIVERFKFDPLILLTKCDMDIEHFNIKNYYDTGTIFSKAEEF